MPGQKRDIPGWIQAGVVVLGIVAGAMFSVWSTQGKVKSNATEIQRALTLAESNRQKLDDHRVKLALVEQSLHTLTEKIHETLSRLERTFDRRGAGSDDRRANPRR